MTTTKVVSAFLYLLKTFFLALSVIGVTKYLVGDGGWINYIIIASPFFILITAKLVILIYGKAFKAMSSKRRDLG